MAAYPTGWDDARVEGYGECAETARAIPTRLLRVFSAGGRDAEPFAARRYLASRGQGYGWVSGKDRADTSVGGIRHPTDVPSIVVARQ